MDLRATACTIEVFQGDKRVASHVRQYGTKRYSTGSGPHTRQPPGTSWVEPRQAEGLGAGIDADVGSAVKGILEAKPHPSRATGLSDQMEATSVYAELSFEDRLGLLVDKEADARESRSLTRRLRAAKLRYPAAVEDLDW